MNFVSKAIFKLYAAYLFGVSSHSFSSAVSKSGSSYHWIEKIERLKKKLPVLVEWESILSSSSDLIGLEEVIGFD